jgi:xanthine dehydrogenase accessory factor
MVYIYTAEILLDYLSPSAQNREFAKHWLGSVSKGKDFFVLTNFRKRGKSIEVIGHAILDTDCNLASSSMLATSDIEKLKPELHNFSTTSVFSLTDSQIMIDLIRKTKTLYCFGAGHVAMPTAHLAALVGFRVVVIDDRAEYANAGRFPEANDIRVIKDFNGDLEGL